MHLCVGKIKLKLTIVVIYYFNLTLQRNQFI